MTRISAALFLLAGCAGALAHSWYPAECCSERDCYPIEVHDVKAVTGGWLVERSTFITYAEARPSPDGKFHICRYQDGKGALIKMPGKPACFWAPMGAS